MIYLLDTNHCSYLIAGNPVAHARLKEIGPNYISTCSIVRGELFFMGHRSARRVANLKKVEWLLSNIVVYDIDSAVANTYGELKAALFDHFGPRDKKKQRKLTLDDLGIGENDLWIAAVAIQYDLTVVSTDGDFQRIKEVTDFDLEQWI